MAIMGHDLVNTILTIAIYAIPVLFAITVNEAAHGYVALFFGDRTAEPMGRITLNPFKHIDLMGTVILPILILLVSQGAFAFGYAKPVPVNFANLRNPKRDMLWVALAGPVSNIIQAIIWSVIIIAAFKLGLGQSYLFKMAQAGIVVNLVLCVLNMLPLPPLDGGRVLVSLLPHQMARVVAKIEPYGFYVLLALLFTGILSKFWISPLLNMGLNLLDWLIFKPLGA